MSSAESIWDDFHLDENCVTVTGDNKVRVYFSQIRRALAALERSVEESTVQLELWGEDGEFYRIERSGDLGRSLPKTIARRS